MDHWDHTCSFCIVSILKIILLCKLKEMSHGPTKIYTIMLNSN
ncbi:hypothetical protein GLYMA_11G192966v4 [Glycine max]|nr:hypothetical protein GLYMA_11G192966v4 [Glycine max]KAH1159357.1 hypothetical protein GYH30_031198 [Glycine max]